MKRIALISTVGICILAQDLLAMTKADSILAFTGAKRAKFSVLRWPWCKPGTNQPDPGFLGDAGWKLGIYSYDTDNNPTWASKIIKPADNNFYGGRIDRSGKWIAYATDDGGCWIRDFAATQPARLVIDKKSSTLWYPVAFWYDSKDKAEYLYCLDGWVAANTCGNNKIYKIPFSIADGTIDPASKVCITFPAPARNLDGGISLSQDGKKIGCAYPWPNTKIYDVSSGTLVDRHNASSSYGCQPNLAPDNSYRFFHCADNHDGVYMFAASMVNTDWFVDFKKNLTGIPANYAKTETFRDPRWSNHPQFVGFGYPMDEGGYFAMDSWYPANVDSTWVKTKMNDTMIASVVIGQWAPDFKSLSSSMFVCKSRQWFDLNMDTWLDNGITDLNDSIGVTTGTSLQETHRTGAAAIRLVRTGDLLCAGLAGGGPVAVLIVDARGKVVRLKTGGAPAAVNLRGLAPGVYSVRAVNGTARAAESLTIAR